MLKRIHIKGFKSLVDVEVELKPLTVLLGPNAAGKSNLLDALGLLSRIVSRRTLKEAFDPPNRGEPLECFSFGEDGIDGLLAQERVSFFIEADLRLSDAVVDKVNNQIAGMRQTEHANGRTPVRKRNLRYRVEVEMLPQLGTLRVADECLQALTDSWTQDSRRKPFVTRKGGKLLVCREGGGHPVQYERHLDRTVLSMSNYPLHHPHLAAAAAEMESWLFYYLEPRECMRSRGPLKEVAEPGQTGEDLAAFLHSLKANKPQQLTVIEKALRLLIPSIDGIELAPAAGGHVELRLRENGVCASARLISEGTLRLLGLLALTGIDPPPSLVGFEEPETGVHPTRVELVAEFLNCQERLGDTQYVVTTHSLHLPDYVAEDSLRVVTRTRGRTQVDPTSLFGPLGRDENGLAEEPSDLLMSERILRGDLDA